MADDALDQVLRMVAEGRLTAAEAFPLIEALERRGSPTNATDRRVGPERATRAPRAKQAILTRQVVLASTRR